MKWALSRINRIAQWIAARSRKKSTWAALLLVFTAASVAFYFLSRVDTELTDEDIAAIEQLDVDDDCESIDGFNDEVTCVRAVQDALLDEVPDQRCVQVTGVGHEPADLLERGYGCCYDRARFIEKALDYYDFDYRHVALYRLEWPVPFGYLQPGIRSHAVTEVKTSRGWMVVDSLDPFIGVDVDGELYDASALKELLGDEARLRDAFGPGVAREFRFDYRPIYGLYSRHGGLFPPDVPVPEIDWSQFTDNFF